MPPPLARRGAQRSTLVLGRGTVAGVPRRAAFVFICALSAAAVISSSCAPRSTYERSPQWRDGRFHNPPAWPRDPTVGDFFRWRFHRREPDASFRPPRVANDGAALRANRDRL